MTRAPVVICLVIVLANCTKHEERYITPWLKVDIVRPVTGSSGVVVSGPSKEVFYTKRGRRWMTLGAGHASVYILMDGERAVLIDLHDGKGLQLAREGADPQPVPKIFDRTGDVVVPPGSESIDVFGCATGAATCREARIDRYDAAGTFIATFRLSLPERYSDCQLLRIAGYDRDAIPYGFAQCRRDSPLAKCVIVAARKDGLFVYAVEPNRPWSECSEFSRAGVALHQPETFVVLQ